MLAMSGPGLELDDAAPKITGRRQSSWILDPPRSAPGVTAL